MNERTLSDTEYRWKRKAEEYDRLIRRLDWLRTELTLATDEGAHHNALNDIAHCVIDDLGEIVEGRIGPTEFETLYRE